MPEDKKEAEKTAAELDTQAKNEAEAQAAKEAAEKAAAEVDYDKELLEEVEKFEAAEKNREGYQKRKAKESDGEEPDDIEAKVAAAIEKALPSIVPRLQSTLAEDTVENMLNELAPGNDAKRKLIKFHFEKSVGTNGTIRERMENAALIADKKAIQKKQTEMATALKNRAGLGATGLGSSTEGQTVPDNILSADQLSDLKAKGWDDKKIERFKKNLRR